MNSSRSSTFSIYRSSAGSGKTYTLAREFVTLAVQNPNYFNKILAVTFTNKATREMKERILKFLRSLAEGTDDDLMSMVQGDTGLSSGQITENAKLVINNVLHQYSNFSVSTIDAFFQKIVKSFARELGLLGNFKVELDQDKVKQDIIDQIMEDVGTNKDLTDWLVQFSFAKVDDNKSWNIRPQIEVLSNEVFKESFRPVSDQLQSTSPKEFKSFLGEVKAIRDEFERQIRSIAERGLELISSHNLHVDDFAYKRSGPAGYFGNVLQGKFEPGKRIKKVLDDPDGWFTKSSLKKEEIKLVVDSGLHEITYEIIQCYDAQIVKYNSANEVLKHVYVFGILSSVIEKLKSYRLENDVMLISDVPVFLQGIIAENEAPFIYEKAGAWFQHYLIDEFQDTSVFQWQNFKPLVENGLAQGRQSLMVGDGKQSIYRWRGGDWGLILSKVQEDLKLFSPEDKVLDTNWRSALRIVEFNNTIFKYLPGLLIDDFSSKLQDLAVDQEERKLLEDKLTDVAALYMDVEQKVSDKQKHAADGMIEINAFLKDTEKSWKEHSLDELPRIVEQIQAQGVQARNIAVLVRRGIEGKQVIEKLIKYKNSAESIPGVCYDAISNESLYLGNSSAIRIIVNTIIYSLDPDNKIAFGEICLNYQSLHLPDDKRQDLSFILEGKFLPDDFSSTCKQLITLPVYEMIERIIQLFDLGKPEYKGYLQAFQDTVLEYFANESKDINDFLVWWKDQGKSKSIQLPESINAVQVMTIHKSKGLEFDAVLIPFCDWKMDHEASKANFLWCMSSEKPFRDMGYLPVKYSSALAKSFFSRDYFVEMIYAHIDNLNLLYVALTRAKKALFINCGPSGNGIKSAGDLVLSSLEDMLEGDIEGLELSVEEHDHVMTSYKLGHFALSAGNVKKDDSASPLFYRSGDWRDKIALRKKGGIFMTASGEEKKEKINYGLLVHEILAGISNQQEADSAIEQYYFEGQISKEERELLSIQLKRIFADPQVQDWFNSDWEVKTEALILLKDKHPKRPDRVLIKDDKAIIIDFKTGLEKPADKKQIRSYKNTLYEMGFTHVETYLLYIAQKNVVKVD